MNEDDDRLALLRAVCEYAGYRQFDEIIAAATWSISIGDDYMFTAHGLDILEPQYCDTLLCAVVRRLRMDGWSFEVSWLSADECFKAAIWRGSRQHGGTDPDHPILAVARASRGAGVISTEEA